MSNKMNMQRFAALSTQGTHAMHFFNTYKEARDYVVRTGGSWYVVKVLGHTKTNFVKEGDGFTSTQYQAVQSALVEFGQVLTSLDPGHADQIAAAVEALP